MLTVSQEFKDAIRSPVKSVSGYIELEDGTQINPDGDLQQYTIDSLGGFLRTAMRKIKVTLLGDHQLQGNRLSVYYGVDIEGTFEYVLIGRFTVEDAVYHKDKQTTVLTGFDAMARFEESYVTVGAYPTTLYQYLQAVASLAGVALDSESIFNGDLVVPEDYYQTMSEYTIRDVLEDICEASASYALINQEGNLELRQVADVGEEFTYSDFIEFELGDYWGGINSLVLSRQPQNDDVFLRDDDDINTPMNRNVLDLNRFSVGYKVNDI